MYLYLGGNTALNSREIVGIFDLDTSTVSKKTRDFLNAAEQSQNTVYTSFDLPKTFVLRAGEKNRAKTALTTENKRRAARAENSARQGDGTDADEAKTAENRKVYITALTVSTLKRRCESPEKFALPPACEKTGRSAKSVKNYFE